MTRRIPILLAATALAAGAGACGGGGGAGGEAADGAREMRDAALSYARCMRQHGVDMPDPKTDENGVILETGGGDPNAGGGASAARVRSADAACRKHLDDAKPPELSAEQQREFKRQALRHAKCMRDNGVDFPDPSFSEDGGAVVDIGPDSGLNPRSPAFRRAQERCRDLMGAPGAGGAS